MIKKTHLLAATLAVTALLSACSGGGDKAIDGSKASALNVCEPTTGPVGTEIVCTDKSITADSTLFFGGKPVEFTLGEEGTATFSAPASLPGDKTIAVKEGDSGLTVLANFDLSVEGSGDVDPSDGGTTGGSGTTGTTGGDIIEPSGTGGTGSETGGETTGGTTGATTGGVTSGGGSGGGTTGETPPAAAASIDTFTVQKVTGGALFSTYKITYAFTGKAAHVSGNLFNRKPGDADLTPAQQCKVQDGNRYLVTNPDGSHLNPAAENYDKYEHLAEGVLCNNANAATADDCKTSSASARLFESPEDGGRFSDPMLRKDRYGYQPDLEIVNGLVLEKDADVMTLNPDYLKFVDFDKNPSCRLDLVKDGALQTSGEFTTRNLAQYGRVCLAVQGDDDAWVVKCKTVEAPKPSVTAPSVTVSASKPAFTLKFGFTNATGAVVSGCTTKSNVALANGTGSYEGECAINSEDKHVDVTLQGIGEHNQKKKKYDVSLGQPEVTLKLYGAEPAASAASDFKLAYKATRTYAIADDDGVVASGSAGWFKDYVFSGFPSGNGTFSVSAPSDVNGTKSAHRDFSHTSWTFKVHDFAGNTYSVSWGKTYAKDFSLLVSGGVNGGMDAYSLAHCNNTPNLTIHMDLPWSAHGVSSLTSTNCTVSGGNSDLADLGKYGGQAGHIYVSKDFGPKDSGWDHSLSCDFKITYYDGEESTRSFTMTGVSCH